MKATPRSNTRQAAGVTPDAVAVLFVEQEHLENMADAWAHRQAIAGTYSAVTHATLAALVLDAADLDAYAGELQAAGKGSKAYAIRQERHRIALAALALMTV